MRLATFEQAGRRALGAVADGKIVELAFAGSMLRQSNSTEKMIWDVAALVSFFSTFYTLRSLTNRVVGA